MKLFLDVGAFHGRALAEALRPEWAFDRLVCFEPAPVNWPWLEAVADHRTEIVKAGLWIRDEERELHDPGAIGASMFAGKAKTSEVVRCRFVDAVPWFRDHVRASDEVFLKVNVEGAEADLLGHLAGAGELGKVDHLLLHFDVRKVPGKEWQEAELRAALDASGVEYIAAEQIMFGRSFEGRMENWLRWCHAKGRVARFHHRWVRRVDHGVRRRLYPLKKWLLS